MQHQLSCVLKRRTSYTHTSMDVYLPSPLNPSLVHLKCSIHTCTDYSCHTLRRSYKQTKKTYIRIACFACFACPIQSVLCHCVFPYCPLSDSIRWAHFNPFALSPPHFFSFSSSSLPFAFFSSSLPFFFPLPFILHPPSPSSIAKPPHIFFFFKLLHSLTHTSSSTCSRSLPFFFLFILVFYTLSCCLLAFFFMTSVVLDTPFLHVHFSTIHKPLIVSAVNPDIKRFLSFFVHIVVFAPLTRSFVRACAFQTFLDPNTHIYLPSALFYFVVQLCSLCFVLSFYLHHHLPTPFLHRYSSSLSFFVISRFLIQLLISLAQNKQKKLYPTSTLCKSLNPKTLLKKSLLSFLLLQSTKTP